MLISIITSLLTYIVNAFQALIQFLIIVALGLVAALLFILPWLIRIAALFMWLAAAYIGMLSIQTIYAPFSDEVPLFALQFALIILMTAWVMVLMMKSENHLWGGLIIGSVSMAVFTQGMNWLSENWRYAGLAFRVLPATLFSVLLLYITLRLRSKRQHRMKANELLLQQGGEA
jgi:hypothetical protein